jgi:hypothetical protein
VASQDDGGQSGADDRAARDALERRYRALLRAYPKAYREQRSEEIIGTLMDAARPGQTTPDWAQRVDLVLAGLRERLRAVTGGRTRPRAGVKTAWSWLTIAAAVLSTAILLAPLASTESCVANSPNDQMVCGTGHESLLGANGWIAVIGVSIPPLVCLTAALLARRWSSWLAVVLLLLFTLAGLASISLLLLPVTVAGIVIAARGERRHDDRSEGVVR